jgi:hypothetical protein
MTVPFTEVEMVIAGVRNRLLELLLQIEKQFPNVSDVTNASTVVKEQVSHFITNNFFAHGSSPAFDTTNIATSGKGNSVNAVVGEGNSNSVK